MGTSFIQLKMTYQLFRTFVLIQLLPSTVPASIYRLTSFNFAVIFMYFIAFNDLFSVNFQLHGKKSFSFFLSLSIYLSISLSFSLSIYLSFFLSFFLSIYLSTLPLFVGIRFRCKN